MKRFAVLPLLLFAQTFFAQQKQANYAEIDNRVKYIATAAPAELAFTLTKHYTTDREKLRAIFSWITEHISYRVKRKNYEFNPGNYMSRALYNDTVSWKSANDMVAETVLRNSSAVCDGYARLFKTLCEYAGLRSAIITGYAKGDLSRLPPFRCNHTWNAIYLDSAWQLLDVTWASGYTSYRGDEFIKHYDDSYFLPAPGDFIRDHYPDDIRWTLMEKPPLPNEFHHAPYRNRSFTKYAINGFSPAGGIIEAAMGDTVYITLETDGTDTDKMAADTITVFDGALQKIMPAIGFAEPLPRQKHQQQQQYAFYVNDQRLEWLHILYNHDTVLRYRLQITPRKNNLAIINRIASLPPGFHP